jgi:hypothetical protein
MNLNLNEFDILGGIEPQLYIEQLSVEKNRNRRIHKYNTSNDSFKRYMLFFLLRFRKKFFCRNLQSNYNVKPTLNLTNFPIVKLIFDGKANLIELEWEAGIRAELHELSFTVY